MNLGDILDILAEKAGGLTLHEAMYVARNIMELHSIGVREADAKGYEEGYKSGHQVGKSTMTLPTPERREIENMQRVYNYQVKRASELLPGIVTSIGSDKKIQVIKELRKQTGLGLKESKDLVDDYVRRLNAAFDGTAEYSDEPPF